MSPLPFGDPEVCEPHGPVHDATVALTRTLDEDRDPDLVAVLERIGNDRVLRVLDAVRRELADRDLDTRELLERIADAQERLADPDGPLGSRCSGPPAGPDAASLEPLARGIDSLATVTSASVDGLADLGRVVERLADAVSGVSARIDRLVSRADEAEARLDRVLRGVSSLADCVDDLALRPGAPPRSMVPTAVDVTDDAPADTPDPLVWTTSPPADDGAPIPRNGG